MSIGGKTIPFPEACAWFVDCQDEDDERSLRNVGDEKYLVISVIDAKEPT